MPALRWTAFAKADLDNLWFHIAQGNGNAADQYLSGLEVAALRHAANPEMGRNEPELSEKFADSIRSFRFRNHRLYYAVRPDEVRVIRVLHLRQDRDANM
jgi:toxin ParE1/3/4